MRVVLDASAGVDSVLAGYRGTRVLDAMCGKESWAPSLVDSEVLSALARLERAGVLTGAEATHALGAWSRVPCQRVPSEFSCRTRGRAGLRSGSPTPSTWRSQTGSGRRCSPATPGWHAHRSGR